MNEIWEERLRKSRERIEAKRRFGSKSRWPMVVFGLLALLFFFPAYPKKLIYPFIFGKPTTQKVDTMMPEYFEDIDAPAFEFSRGGLKYKLQPRTKYAVAARVGFVDHYDTLFNKMFRGHSQNDYITLVPQDLFLLNGSMAKPETFKLFEFEHEERLGRILCKGVKYRKSFADIGMSEKEARRSMENLAKCDAVKNTEEYNNYHPIPASERINKALHTLVAGDTVYLEGYLVDVPSMRMHTGTRKRQSHADQKVNGISAGMCFILYTTKVIINNRVYE